MPNKTQAKAPQKSTKRSSKVPEPEAQAPAQQAKKVSACEAQGESSEACIDERIKALENDQGHQEERLQDRLEEQSQAQEQAHRIRIGNALLGEEIPA